MKTMTSREFHQNTSQAVRDAETGPVIVTNRGEEAFVVLSAQEFRRLNGKGKSLGEMLSNPEAAEIDLESHLSSRKGDFPRPVDFD